MSCADTRSLLVEYCFGELAGASRERLEAHILECSSCVRELVALKRAIEVPDVSGRPSPAARSRLRREVAAEVEAPARPWAWWQRPAAFALAGASVAAAILFIQIVSGGSGHMPNSLEQPDDVVEVD